jgi:hypothetical protein
MLIKLSIYIYVDRSVDQIIDLSVDRSVDQIVDLNVEHSVDIPRTRRFRQRKRLRPSSRRSFAPSPATAGAIEKCSKKCRKSIVSSISNRFDQSGKKLFDKGYKNKNVHCLIIHVYTQKLYLYKVTHVTRYTHVPPPPPSFQFPSRAC